MKDAKKIERLEKIEQIEHPCFKGVVRPKNLRVLVPVLLMLIICRGKNGAMTKRFAGPFKRYVVNNKFCKKAILRKCP